MKQSRKAQDTTMDRRTYKVAGSYLRTHKRGSCPRCGSGRPCFITVAERIPSKTR